MKITALLYTLTMPLLPGSAEKIAAAALKHQTHRVGDVEITFLISDKTVELRFDAVK